MIAAIYARKSTDQNVSDEEKSIARQVARARAYVERRGWTVADDHVYVDDGISGADFVRRAGDLRLMNALKSRPPFQVLVMMEQSRLGRSLREVPYALSKILGAGVRVFCYLEDKEIRQDSLLDEFQTSVMAFVDAMHREQSRQRTRDAMQGKARRGHVAGGKVYGYRNRDVTIAGADGRGVRDHVEREIVEDQAAIMRRIFAEAAGGCGFSRIAKALNAEGVPSPARGRGWATTGVREVLVRELYRGRIIYGRTNRLDPGSAKSRIRVPEAQWIVREAPELRIVSEQAWRAAHARLEATRAVYRKSGRGALWGRPAAIAGGHGSRYLLSGLLLCGECGWGLHATHRTSQRGEPQRYYVCTAYRTRGETVCTNRYSAPMEGVHAEVLATLRRKVLKPDLVRDVVGRALELRAARPAALEEQRQALAGELQRLETELRRYAEAVGAGDHPLPALLEAMGAREQRRREIRAQLEELATPRVHVTDVAVYGEASRRLTDWQGLLERHPADARGVLQDLLRGRLVVTPTLIDGGRWFEFRGEATYGALLRGLVGVNGMVAPG